MPSVVDILIYSGVSWTKAIASQVWIDCGVYYLSTCEVILGRVLQILIRSDKLGRMHAALCSLNSK